ncbi:MAG: hypothetical protein ACLPKB_32835 [Xanthobacteraceae bacterium]
MEMAGETLCGRGTQAEEYPNLSSSIDPEAANISREVVTATLVKGLMARDTGGSFR